jgi:hypothetical protein
VVKNQGYKNQFLSMKVEISIGELLDKLSILMIKSKKITDESKLENIRKELEELKNAFPIENSDLGELFNELVCVNEQLWVIEDRLRQKEREKVFDDEFISLARSVYFTNDKRSEIKKVINKKTHSNIVEEKSYEKYD